MLRHKLNKCTIKQQENSGYINAKEICDLADKHFFVWQFRPDTQDLILKLSQASGIPVYNLILKEEKDIWIHPDLAVSLASWANPGYAIAVSSWVKNWTPKPKIDGQISVEQAMAIADWSVKEYEKFGISASLLKLRTFAELRPDLAHAFEPLIKAISAKNPLPEKTYSPTEIGKILSQKMEQKFSAIAVNKKLVELGLQQSIKRINSKGKEVHHYFEPIDNGKGYGQVELSAFKSKEASVTKPNTRWHLGIVDLLVVSLMEKAQLK